MVQDETLLLQHGLVQLVCRLGLSDGRSMRNTHHHPPRTRQDISPHGLSLVLQRLAAIRNGHRFFLNFKLYGTTVFISCYNLTMKYLISGAITFIFSLLLTINLGKFHPSGVDPFSSAYPGPHWSLPLLVYLLSFLFILFGYLTIRLEKKYIAGVLFIIFGISMFLTYSLFGIPIP